MWFFSFIRCAVALYGLTLEAFYSFDALPVTVSDEIKKMLKAQAKTVNYFSAIISLFLLTILLYLIAVFLVVRGAVHIAMYCCPKFRELVNKRIAERALKAQNKKNYSKRAVLRSVMFNLSFSVLLIVNDIVFNRPEGAFQEGILERLDHLLQDALTIIWVQAGMVSSVLFLTILLPVACAIYRSRCQRRAVADEEIHLAPGNMAEAEAEGQKTLEEMLAPLLKDIDAIYEKMEEAIEEPLIKLPQSKS
ncbi:hypothetical protein F5051DRAFT_406590 [Lentinula edodes]|nr:hypothetical protein F5051DRAFT_406590 [Lentinula edodes]